METTDKQKEKFLPCPFCGRLPELINQYFKYLILHPGCFMEPKLGWMRKRELIEKWNTRTPPPTEETPNEPNE